MWYTIFVRADNTVTVVPDSAGLSDAEYFRLKADAAFHYRTWIEAEQPANHFDAIGRAADVLTLEP